MGQVNLSAAFMKSMSNLGNLSSAKVSMNQSEHDFSNTLSKAKSSNQIDQKAEAKRKPSVNEKQPANEIKKESAPDKVGGEKSSSAEQTSKTDKKDDAAQKADNDKINKSDKVDETSKNGEDKEAKEEPVSDVSTQILNIVSQALNMPVDELKQVLSTLKMEPEDLLTTEGFGQFMSEVLAQGDVKSLLTGETDIKEINQMFDELQSLAQETDAAQEPDHSVLKLRAHLQEAAATNQVDAGSPQEVVNADQATGQKITEVNQIAHQTVQPNGENKYDEANNATQDHLVQNTEQVMGAEDVGITVPVHNFTSTTFKQTYQLADGTVTQTTVTQRGEENHFVLEQVDFKALGETRELSVQLSPKELGTMNIKIIENNGALVAEIKVENEKTKEFIQNEIATLKENLEEQGLNVADVKVDVRQDDAQSQMQQERQKSSKRIQEIINEQYGEEDETEEVSQAVVNSDSEVDYMV